VSGKAEFVRKAIDALVSEGYLQMVPGRVVAGKPSAVYISVREYREETDPLRDSGASATVLRSAGEVSF
jgi:DNA-binding GntR family transcriptional regulator